MKSLCKTILLSCVVLLCARSLEAGTATDSIGYYRFPALHDTTIVFTAEGDLWTIGTSGGAARRLTTHPGPEIYPAISSDGKSIAFTARYEGPSEVYTMPIGGGLPVRRTFEGGWTRVVGWTPDNNILFATSQYATLPNTQMALVDPKTNTFERVPLEQASDGSYGAGGKTLYFTRFPFQGSYTKRYEGGMAQNIWKFTDGDPEALPLTKDYSGTSKTPMWWNNRIYFISDRDGSINIWSMDESGQNPTQHTFHKGWDIKSPSLSNGKIAYQLKADIWLYDITANEYHAIPITLASDFDHQREKWVKKPWDFLTALHVSPDGDRVVLTARGQIFTAPVKQGRIVQATHKNGVRYRQALFLPDGKNLLALSDESGEVEFWKIPANGVGDPEQITDNGTVLRSDGTPSPDGKKFAHTDHDGRFFIYDFDKKQDIEIKTNNEGAPADLAWSPDNRWLAYVDYADTWFRMIKVYDTKNDTILTLTTDRYDSFSPAWSADGKWIYFLSDRNFHSLITNPWVTRQPGPYFDRQTKLYMLPLVPNLRSPFRPVDELVAAKSDDKKDEKNKDKKTDDKAAADSAITVTIDPKDIMARLLEVPVPPGNYVGLSTTETNLYWMARETPRDSKWDLLTTKITNEEVKVDTVMSGITAYELTLDTKKAMIRKGESVYVIDANGAKPGDLDKSQVNLSGWTFPLDPKLEWLQMFVEAWRLERDYFYDPKMHGVDWDAILKKYKPLAYRLTDRDELSDLLGSMISELSALHMYVFGGDFRRGDDNIDPASLGAVLTRDTKAGGYRIDHIYLTDPDEPHLRSPLAQPDLDISEGDIITAINGVATLSVDHPALLLRNQADKQVLVEIKPAHGKDPRQVIVTPISHSQEGNLRYSEWEYTRRLMVEKESNGDIAYAHLRAMSVADYEQWSRDFAPSFLKQGLIVDVRHNGGGNIDSWILEELMRKAFAYWQSRVGRPYSNMQYAFSGHIVVLCDEYTASDGEMFVEGFHRLGLGKSIGTRTWGGEIWLSYGNVLVDRGIASAAESGVFGPEGDWLIEGHGVEPDIVVDNLPHETYNGRDAQLEAALEYLKEQIRLHPVETPSPPPYPDKSFDN